MKIQFFKSAIAGILLLALYSCSKQESIDEHSTKVINLTINTSTNAEDLEFVYKNNVIASVTPALGEVVSKLHLIVGEGNETITVRKKGTATVVDSRIIAASPYDQTLNVYYDGNKVYTSAVKLKIKGYVMIGELEFLLDGKIIAQGTGVIDNKDNLISIGVDKNGTREIQVRKKGETALLITKTINPLPAQQTIGFLFDGTTIVDNVKLNPPSNPANMLVSAKFESQYPDLYKKVDVDLVFYVRNIKTGVSVKVNPELRFTLPANGAFASFELPPLPNQDYDYKFDIFEKGTNAIPYDTSTLPAAYPVKPSNGQEGSAIVFEAGKSKLFLIKDMNKRILTPVASRAYYFYGIVTDLSQYFQ